MMIAGILIVLVVAGVVGLMMYAWTGPPDDERYCLKCSKTTTWHPETGCRECEWADRQW